MPKFIITDGYGTQIELLPDTGSYQFTASNTKNTSFTPKHRAEVIYNNTLTDDLRKYFSIVNITNPAISKRGYEKAKSRCRRAICSKMKGEHISVEEVLALLPYVPNNRSVMYRDISDEIIGENKQEDETEGSVLPEEAEEPNAKLFEPESVEYFNVLADENMYDCEQLRVIIKFLSVFTKNVCAEVNELNKQLLIANQEIQDIHHYLELKDLSDEEELEAAKKLKDALVSRRTVKDTLNMARLIANKPLVNEGALNAVNKSISGISSRQYTPRRLNELFK